MRWRRFREGLADFFAALLDFALEVLGDLFDSRW